MPLPGFRQFFDHVLSRQHAGAEFPPVLVGVDGFLVAQFEHVSALLAEVDVGIHHLLKLLGSLNPVVFNGVRQAAEEVELVPQAAGQHLVHLLDPDLVVVAGGVLAVPAHLDEVRAELADLAEYGWDPERLFLLARLVTALRRARDRRIFIPHCAWETMFVDPNLNVFWISPFMRSGTISNSMPLRVTWKVSNAKNSARMRSGV